MEPTVTVSVVSHAQRGLLARLLDDLRRLDPSWLARLVVTLNVDEPDPDLAGWRSDKLIVIRNRVPLGFGANHNQAFKHCVTDWFAVLNPDLRVPVDGFSSALVHAEPDVGLVAPVVRESDGRLADSARALLTPFEVVRRRIFGSAGSECLARPPDWLAGMCLFVRSSAFREVGGFDERYFMYCEDADLSLRLQLAGWRLCYCRDVAVEHHAQRATYRSAKHLGWHLRSVCRHWMSQAYWDYMRLQRGRAVPR